MAVLALLALLMPVLPVVAGTDVSGDPTPMLLLVRVAPSTPLEFVTIQNVSNRTMDLRGYTIDDGEGWIKLNETMPLKHGERLSFSPDPVSFRTYYPEEMVMAYRGEHAITHGTLALADKGDQVSLIGPGGELVDTFCYGAASTTSGWAGSPFTPLPKGDMAVRDMTVHDTDTASDWFRSCAGRSERDITSYEGTVEPFTSPEDAQMRMVREIGYARESIEACVYEMGDPLITRMFSDAEADGVKVRILIEGQPVTGLSNSSKTAVATLVSSGCDVRLMISNQSYRRYDCLHAKYFVIDRERVTVMSENWAGGLITNRGWGATVVSPGLARDVIDMFQEDSSLDRRDVKEASPMVKDWYAPPTDVDPLSANGRNREPVTCDVSLIVSPDTAYRGILGLISSATSRLLVEQLYIDPAWVGKNQIMDELIDAASRGVKVRVLLDQTFVDTSDTRNNSMTVDALNTQARELGIDLEARLISDYHDLGVLHNKGVIADDRVLVSSINWVDASVFQNREIGLIISSSSMAAFFADFFWNDWAVDPDPPSIRLPWNNLTLSEGQPLLLDATKCNDNAGIASYFWTDGRDGRQWNGSYQMVYLELGVHEITLEVTDRFGNTATARLLVIVNPLAPVDETNYLILVPAGGVGLAGLIWFAWKRNKRR